MCWTPIREIENIHAQQRSSATQPLKEEISPLADFRPELIDISADFSPGEASEVTFLIHGVAVRYDVKLKELSCGNCKAPLPEMDGHVRLRILVDRTSFEIFGNDGEVYMPLAVHGSDDLSLKVSAKGNGAKLHSLVANELKSIWNDPGAGKGQALTPR
jgi:sucrose-6-phosphate hydrolase SacC (GH32 family)